MFKRERAIELRDLALVVVKRRGQVMPFGKGSAKRFYRDGSGRRSITIAYRIPERGCHDLDITTRTGLLKIEWSDDGRVNVVSYKPGAWEQRLAELSRVVAGNEVRADPCAR
jgi:hypothetical protein